MHPPKATVEDLIAHCALVPARAVGDAQVVLAGVAPLSTAQHDQLSFLANPRYLQQVSSSSAGCVVLSERDYNELPNTGGRTFVICSEPYVFFALAAQLFAHKEAVPAVISPLASIHETALIEPGVDIQPFAVIEAGAHICAGARIGAHCVIGARVQIGANTVLFPRVTLYAGCKIGARCVIHSGAVIGADGFGFANHAGTWIKIPQTGGVVIGDDCEIGANTAIDRGAMSDTIIGNDVKIDNQVQIGHNTVVGDHCAFAGCVGIAGSTTIGKRVQLGGAAMVIGHLRIGDDVVISAASTVLSDIVKPGFYTGIFPIDDNASWERNAVLVRNLDKMRHQLKRLQAQLESKDDNKS
jgi:UDP-3-O-[3-hydroxymyristoyl] glucosamine N-acyltransferase